MTNPIAFIHDFGASVYTINGDGSSPTRITFADQWHSVRWRRDGAMLAIASATTDTNNIKAVNPDGSGPVTITPGAPPYGFWGDGGDWSPDDSQFATPWTTGGAPLVNPGGIALFATDGSGTHTLITLGPADTTTINTGGGTTQPLVWFPDDSGFAYTRLNSLTFNSEICTCARDGSGITAILPATGNEWWGLCDYFSNGDLLVMLTPQDVPEGKLIRCARDGSAQTVLYDDAAGTLIGHYNPSGAATSPDETQIAVMCNDNTLRTMPAAGGTLTTIYTASANAPGQNQLAWNPHPPPRVAPQIFAGQSTSGIVKYS